MCAVPSRAVQLHEVPVARLAPLEEVRAVHSYVDDLQRVAQQEAPKAVADIGDPGVPCGAAMSWRVMKAQLPSVVLWHPACGCWV